jgi:hypothetical protein
VLSKSQFQHGWIGACLINSISAWFEKDVVKKSIFSMVGKGWTDWTGPTYKNSETGRRRKRRRFVVPRPGATLSHLVKKTRTE